MSMSQDDSINLLLKLIDEDHTSDITTILEKWRDQREAWEAQQIAQVQQRLQPTMYGIMEVVAVPQSSDDSHQFMQYQPIRKYRVRHQDVSAFAKAHKLRESDLWQLLNGDINQLDKWRSWEGMGLANSPYRPSAQEKSAMVKQMKQEDAKHEQYLNRQPVYQTPKDAPLIDWTKE